MLWPLIQALDHRATKQAISFQDAGFKCPPRSLATIGTFSAGKTKQTIATTSGATTQPRTCLPISRELQHVAFSRQLVSVWAILVACLMAVRRLELAWLRCQRLASCISLAARARMEQPTTCGFLTLIAARRDSGHCWPELAEGQRRCQQAVTARKAHSARVRLASHRACWRQCLD